MTIRRRTLLAAAGLSALAGCTAGSSGTTPSASGEEALTIGLTYIPNVQFCAFYLGQELGIFGQHQLAVTLRHHGEQEDIFGAVLAGQEQVVFASADEAMVAAAGGHALSTFATSYQQYPAQIIGLGDGGTDLSVLAGSSLGVPGRYGSSYFAALAALHEAGLTEDDVALQEIGYTQLSALQSGQVDYIVGFKNNEAVQLGLLGLTPRAIEIFDEPRLVGPSLITAGDAVAAGTLQRLAAALKEAEEAVIADPAAALEATAKQVPALADTEQRTAAEAVLSATTELWRVGGEVSVAVDEPAFERMGQFLVTAGIIEAVPEQPYRRVG